MTTRGVWCGRTVLAMTTAWLAARGGVDAWIIGLAFGLVILAWTATRPRQLVSLASLAFALCAALICELVSRIALYGFFHVSRWGGGSRMALAAALLAGTVLLPVAHAALLKAPWRRAAVAVAGITLTSLACAVVVPRMGSLTLGALAVVWQTAYLVFFFAPTPQLRPVFNPE